MPRSFACAWRTPFSRADRSKRGGRDRGLRECERGGWVRVLVAALAVACVVALSSSSARAQEDEEEGGELEQKLERAVQLIEDKPLDYLAAQKLLFEVVRSGQGTPELMAQAYFTLGRVEAALEHGVESSDSFYLAMMIQPSLFLPQGSSPKVVSRLNEARNRVIEVGVLQASLSLDDGTLVVHLDNDPLGLVHRMEVRMTRGEGEVGTATVEKQNPRVAVEPGVTAIEVVLLDELGNQLKVLEMDPGDAAASEDINPALVGRGPTLWERWPIWAGVAGALAAGGLYFTMEAGSLQEDLDAARGGAAPNDSVIQRLEDDKDRVSLYGVVGFSLAGAAAVTSAVLLLTGSGDAEDPEVEEGAEAAFVPTVGPGHLGARLNVSF